MSVLFLSLSLSLSLSNIHTQTSTPKHFLLRYPSNRCTQSLGYFPQTHNRATPSLVIILAHFLTLKYFLTYSPSLTLSLTLCLTLTQFQRKKFCASYSSKLISFPGRCWCWQCFAILKQTKISPTYQKVFRSKIFFEKFKFPASTHKISIAITRQVGSWVSQTVWGGSKPKN